MAVTCSSSTPPVASPTAKSPKRKRAEASEGPDVQDAAKTSENDAIEATETTSTSDSSSYCGECGQEFVLAAELVAHGRETQHRPFVCIFNGCNKSFLKQEPLIRHMETVHKAKERKRFTCEVCQATFAFKHGLKRHVQRAHKEQDSPMEEVEEQEDEAIECDGVKCCECGQQFVYATELVAHGRETQHRPFGCSVEDCRKSYSKQEHLTRHVETVHNTQTEEGRTPFKCLLCQTTFAYKHGLTRHMQLSHKNENKPFECSVCLLAFKKKTDLQAHTYVHTGVPPFECEDCGLRFLKKYLLTRHQRSHAQKKAENQVFACDCSEIFFSQAELEDHQRTGHGNAIEEADKVKTIATLGVVESKPDNAAVRAEAAADLKEKQEVAPSRLKCRVCDQTFLRMQYLRSHLRTHFASLNERKQFVCPMPGCEKSYTRSSNLMTHYNAVHDERKSKRFVCPREGCDARFGYKTVLKNHLEKVHDNPVPPKRRKRNSVGVLARALGVNQVGDVAVATSTAQGEESTSTSADVEMEDVQDEVEPVEQP